MIFTTRQNQAMKVEIRLHARNEKMNAITRGFRVVRKRTTVENGSFEDAVNTAPGTLC